MHKSNDNTVEIDATIEYETDSAYLLDVGEPDKVWMPKSQVWDVQRGSGRLVKMTVTEWIANEKGLI